MPNKEMFTALKPTDVNVFAKESARKVLQQTVQAGEDLDDLRSALMKAYMEKTHQKENAVSFSGKRQIKPKQLVLYLQFLYTEVRSES
jgi:hypothetical protein